MRISKTVREREEAVEEQLFSEAADVERVPVDQIVDRPPQIRTEEDRENIALRAEEVTMERVNAETVKERSKGQG